MGLDYREFAPSAPIADYVECIWSLRGPGTPRAEPERVLPDGRAELVWNLADPFLRHTPGAPPRLQAAALLVGQITGPLRLQPTGRIDLLGVRFRTAALGAFLRGVPTHELTDRDFSADEVLGQRFRTLIDEVAGAATPGARVEIVEARLEADLRQRRPIDARVAAAVAAIGAADGTRRVDEIAAIVGLSPRQLERLFLFEVGVAPKRLSRIRRFQRLVALVPATEPAAWARLAVRCGYYDQAHLIRDFHEFTGGPPGDFLLDGERRLTEVFLGG